MQKLHENAQSHARSPISNAILAITVFVARDVLAVGGYFVVAAHTALGLTLSVDAVRAFLGAPWAHLQRAWEALIHLAAGEAVAVITLLLWWFLLGKVVNRLWKPMLHTHRLPPPTLTFVRNLGAFTAISQGAHAALGSWSLTTGATVVACAVVYVAIRRNEITAARDILEDLVRHKGPAPLPRSAPTEASTKL